MRYFEYENGVFLGEYEISMTEGESTSEAGRTEAASEFVYTQITTIYYTCWGEIPRDCRETDRTVTYVLKEVTSLAGVGPDGMDYPGSGPSESMVNMCPHPFMTGQYIECPEDMCPFGFEKVDDVCLEECPEGHIRDENGNCNADTPCEGDPLKEMEISDDNSSKNANRYGCVREQWDKDCNEDGVLGDKKHKGIDLAVPVGTPVFAIATGTVLNTGYDATGWGHWIMIVNNNTYYLYAHLREAATVTGTVNFGAIIGFSGSTGNANAEYPHLHLEVRTQLGNEIYNNMEIENPEDFLLTEFDDNGNVVEDSDC